MKNRLILIAGLLVAVLVAVYLYDKYRVAPKIKLTELALSDLNGQPVSLDTFRNEKLFINFFATWCGPCVKELPSIDAAQQVLKQENFRFILISDEPAALLQNFSERTGNRFLILRSERKLQQYSIFTIPTSYLLNTKGEIIFKHTGEEDWVSQAMLATLKEAE